MRSVRFRIDQLMIWVAVLAANLALCRKLYETAFQLLAVAIAPLVVFQAVAVRQRKAKGRARAFWLGFVVGGGLASLDLVGTLYALKAAIGFGDVTWIVYLGVIVLPLLRSSAADALSGIPFFEEIAVLMLVFIPILLIAGLSGLAARWAYDRWNRSTTPPAGASGEHSSPTLLREETENLIPPY